MSGVMSETENIQELQATLSRALVFAIGAPSSLLVALRAAWQLLDLVRGTGNLSAQTQAVIVAREALKAFEEWLSSNYPSLKF